MSAIPGIDPSVIPGIDPSAIPGIDDGPVCEAVGSAAVAGDRRAAGGTADGDAAVALAAAKLNGAPTTTALKTNTTAAPRIQA